MTSKFLHFFGCFIATAITIFILYGYYEEPLWKSQVIGIVVGCLLGAGKETVVVFKGGTWDWYNIAADVVGIICPTLFAFGL